MDHHLHHHSDHGVMEAGAEIVYGTHEDNTMVMSEKVQSLAGSIYQEFERMIQRYDEDVVKTLMPLLVNVLECLDAAYQTNQEQDVELELLREDNEQLVTQYEREKGARKQAEQKLLDTEDLAESENKELASRLESLESIVRMLELKHKNSLEHASRLEERESELKKEYSKLHDRYTELFKTHVDYMERTKLMMGSTHSQMSSTSERLDMNRGAARLHPMSRSSGPVSYGFASLENSAMLETETICSPNASSASGSGPPSLQNELDNLADGQTNDGAEATAESSPDVTTPVTAKQKPTGHSTTKKEQRSANTLYQELSFQDNEESEEHEVTGNWVHPGEYASSVNDNFFGMGKEVENLILENNELLATKNALNIVKDDLIVKVDELSGEIEILREELNNSNQNRAKLKQRVAELEDDLKKTKEQVKQQTNSEQEDEGEVPMAQRKRFTRVEMARVLMERNQYKERFMELQEAVRWTEMIRATRTVDSLDKKSKHKFWKFFSNLFSSHNEQQNEPPGPLLRYNNGGGGGGDSSSSAAVAGGGVTAASTEGRITHHVNSHHQQQQAGIASITQAVTATNHGTRAALLLANKDFGSDGQTAMQRKSEHYRQVRAHVQKEDGRLHAYGWSLPGTKGATGSGDRGISVATKNSSSGVKVPVPVYCQPIAEANPHMKVFCASGVNLNGGFNRDGGSIFGTTILNAGSQSHSKIVELVEGGGTTAGGEMDSLDKQLTMALETADPDLALSSYVWICTSTHSASTVTVIDANDAAVVLDSFPVCQTHLLCICTVSGALEKDYALSENSEVTRFGEALEKPGDGGEDEVGRVEFVRVEQPMAGDEEKKATPCSETTTDDEKTEKAAEVVAPAEVAAIPVVTEDAAATKTVTGLDALKFSKPVNPILGSMNPLEEAPLSSIGPTMWMGAQNGQLYVHSAVARWRDCLHAIQLPDAILAIVHLESRVIAALANGKLAIFRRATDGQWDLRSYHLLTLGNPKQSVRCLCVVGDKLWAAYRNKIYIVDPISLNIVHMLEAHPRKESQVRLMSATGAGVWVSIRLDSTLRLYHANTFEHLDDVDIEPYVSKMLGTGKLGFSFVRITALQVSCNRLWIGTGNGVIISVPLSDGSVGQGGSGGSGGGASSTSAATSKGATMYNRANFIPRCYMANAQLSFHGHRDAVKFFVSIPMTSALQSTTISAGGSGPQSLLDNPLLMGKLPDMLVVSGGEGYIDFRLGDDMENSIVLEPTQTIENRGDKSYLIVWQVSQN